MRSWPTRWSSTPAALAALVATEATVWLLWRRFNATPPAVGLEFPFDLVRYYIPNAQGAASRILGGELPLWNPSGCGGLPFLATLQVGIFYPGNWLSLLMPAERAIPLLMLWETGLGAAFTYFLFRTWSHAPLASALAGALYAFGCLLGQSFWPPALSTLMWLPWLLICVDKLARGDPRWRWWLGLSAGTAFQLLAGFPQFAVYSFYLVIALGALGLAQRIVVAPGARLEALRSAIAIALAIGLGVGLASVQLLPTQELVGLSSRASKLEADDVHYLAEHKPPASVRAYLQNSVDPSPKLISLGYGDESGYMAIATWILAAGGLMARRRSPRLWLLVGAGAMGLALSEGHSGFFAPVFRLYAALPTGGMFRSPERLQLLTLFATLAAAAAGADALARAHRTPGRERAIIWLAAAVAAATCAGFGATGSAWRAAVAVGLVGIGLARLPRGLRTGAQLALGALLVFDLAAATGAHGSLRALPMQWSREFHLWGHRAISAPQAAAMGAELGESRIALHGFDTAAVTPLRRLLCYEPLALGAWFDLEELAKTHTPPGLGDQPDAAIYDVASVATIIAIRPRQSLDDAEIQRMGDRVLAMFRYPAPAPQPHPRMLVRRVENPNVLPRAYVVGNHRVATPHEARLAVVRGDFDFQNGVILDRPLVGATSRAGERVRARLVVDAPEEVEIDVSGPGGILVLTDSFYPGWRARVDGVDTEIARANGLFRAVAVAPGPHRVRFEYRPESLRTGLTISLVSGLALCAAPVAGRALRGRSRRAA